MKTGPRNRWHPRAAWLAALALAFAALPWEGARADLLVQRPPDMNPEDSDGDGNPYNDHVFLHMGAGDGWVTMADGRVMYCFGFTDLTNVPDSMAIMEGMLAANFVGPTMVFREGQKAYVTLTNVGMMQRPDLFDPHTIHFHGFPNASSIFDGVPAASIAINMGASLTYFYNIVEPGTYMWHCHVEATEHMEMGMLAQVYVLPKQDLLPDNTALGGFTHRTGYKYCYNDGDGSTYYDVDYPIQLHSFDPDFHEANATVQPLPFADLRGRYAMFNGRGYPDTVKPGPIVTVGETDGMPRDSQKVNSLIYAEPNQKVLLRLSNLSTSEYFTVSVPNIPMRVVGKGARLLRGPDGKDLSYTTTSVDLGGGEAADVILDTTDIEPGTYFFHTTNLNYLANDAEDFGGMMTEIIIELPLAVALALPADGAGLPLAPPPTFTWTNNEVDPVTFQIQFNMQPGFTDGGVTVPMAAAGPITGTTHTLTTNEWAALRSYLGSQFATDFYWRVLVTNQATGRVRATGSRLATLQLGTLVLQSPADGIQQPAGTRPILTLGYTGTELRAFYFQLSTDPSFATPNRTLTVQAPRPNRSTGLSWLRLSNRQWNTVKNWFTAQPKTVFWRAYGQTADGLSRLATPPRSFTIVP